MQRSIKLTNGFLHFPADKGRKRKNNEDEAGQSPTKRPRTVEVQGQQFAEFETPMLPGNGNPIPNPEVQGQQLADLQTPMLPGGGNPLGLEVPLGLEADLSGLSDNLFSNGIVDSSGLGAGLHDDPSISTFAEPMGIASQSDPMGGVFKQEDEKKDTRNINIFNVSIGSIGSIGSTRFISNGLADDEIKHHRSNSASKGELATLKKEIRKCKSVVDRVESLAFQTSLCTLQIFSILKDLANSKQQTAMTVGDHGQANLYSNMQNEIEQNMRSVLFMGVRR